jgi:hypothetical protein
VIIPTFQSRRLTRWKNRRRQELGNLDLAKFLALLTTESPYFASPSRLQDPFKNRAQTGRFP